MTKNKVSAEEFLKHHGVLGMKWGVRRFQPYPKGSKNKGKFLNKTKKAVRNSRVGQEVRSRAREAKALIGKNNIDNMSTKDLQQRTRRLQQENDMKRLTSTTFKPSFTAQGRKQQRKEREDYRNRGDMSDQELNRKVDRLRAKDLYNQNANKAGKEIIDSGKRVAKSAAALGAAYKTKNGAVDAKDVYDAIMTPDHSLVKSSAELFSGNEAVQDALKRVLKK